MHQQPMRKKYLTLKTDNLNPDGLEFVIDWNSLSVGASVFIPAINTTHLIKEMHQIAKDKNIKLEERVLIDGGKWGVRFWRIM